MEVFFDLQLLQRCDQTNRFGIVTIICSYLPLLLKLRSLIHSERSLPGVKNNEHNCCRFQRYWAREADPPFFAVSRIKAVSDVLDIAVLLDVNFDLYPLSVGDKISFVLATKLSQSEGSKDAYKRDKWAPHLDEKTLADDYDYVMYGKVYKYEEHKMHKAYVISSILGLVCASGCPNCRSLLVPCTRVLGVSCSVSQVRATSCNASRPG